MFFYAKYCVGRTIDYLSFQGIVMGTYTAFSDEELVDFMKTGNEAAFAELYKRNWEGLYQYCFNILPDEDVVKDVLQEVFVWFWNHRAELKVYAVRSYLSVAVKHKMANYLRNEKTRDNFYEKVKLDLNPAVDESALEVKELIEFIRDFTTDLPEKCRLVFQLSRTEHLSNKEIASRLNISEKTVETHITTALNKLRKKMGRTSAWLFFLS